MNLANLYIIARIKQNLSQSFRRKQSTLAANADNYSTAAYITVSVGTVGIEVPNKERVTIPMADMLYSDEYDNSDMELPLCIGRKVDCSVFMVDLADMPHLLIAGATGMGKSVGLNAIITSLINKKSPDELKMVLVDPKQVELTVYEKIAKPYLLKLNTAENAIITDTDDALKMLNEVCRIMDERYLKLKDMNVRNIKEYNAVADETLPYYVVVIDEYGDLIMQSDGLAMGKREPWVST